MTLATFQVKYPAGEEFCRSNQLAKIRFIASICLIFIEYDLQSYFTLNKELMCIVQLNITEITHPQLLSSTSLRC